MLLITVEVYKSSPFFTYIFNKEAPEQVKEIGEQSAEQKSAKPTHR